MNHSPVDWDVANWAVLECLDRRRTNKLRVVYLGLALHLECQQGVLIGSCPLQADKGKPSRHESDQTEMQAVTRCSTSFFFLSTSPGKGQDRHVGKGEEAIRVVQGMRGSWRAE